MVAVHLRPAVPHEAKALTALAMRSKGHWGYDETFLRACKPDLALRPEDLALGRVVVAERDDQVLGFYSVDGEPPEGELGNLWVEPTAIGCGVGRLLWSRALEHACDLGFRLLRIAADPNAAGFYQAMGARLVGTTPSTVFPGRELPELIISLSDRPGSQDGPLRQ